MTPTAPSYDPSGQTPRPYVRFDRRPREIREDGASVFVDSDWVTLMAPGSRDTVEMLVEDWLAKLRDHSKAGRVPQMWPSEYAGAYAAWKETQEQPLVGTSVKNWAAISPAQRENCLRANVLTVEDLANANAESLARLGMGSIGLKQMAEAWVKDQKGPGALAAQLQAALKRLEALEARNDGLEKANEALKAVAKLKE